MNDIRKEPKWINELLKKYKIGVGNIFAITGNINDYVAKDILLVDYLRNVLGKIMDNIICYDHTNLVEVMKASTPEIEDIYSFEDVLDILKNQETKNLVIFRYPRQVIPPLNPNYADEHLKSNIIKLHRVINSKSFLKSYNMVIFISDIVQDINEMFVGQGSRTHVINIDYANELERLEFIEWLFNGNKDDKEEMSKIKKMDCTITKDQFAKFTAGLTRLNIEDIFLTSLAKQILTRNLIMDKKKELIEKEFGDVIELFDVEGYSLDDFAGQEKIKKYHQEVIIDPLLNTGDTSIVPKGLLYGGPPGVGKTYFAKCFAGMANFNFVEFKLSKILNKYVGESERNLAKAFACFESLSPCGIFLDELDQVLGRGKEDSSGVRSSIFGAFLSFMSNPSHRGKIIFIAATNYPNLIDEALKRPGRFDKKIPFLPPNEKDRENVFKIHLKKTQMPCSISDFTKLVKATEGYTQAEIEDVIIKALEITKRRKLNNISEDILTYAITCIIPRNNDKIEEMIKVAIAECNDIEFLPDEYREKYL